MTTDIPPEITTPDTVETRIGTLKFLDGFPDDATVQPFRLTFLAGKSISLARWVEAAVFLKFLENLPSLAVGHESGQYLPQAVFFCGRLVREEDQLLKLHPTMNGF